MEKRLSRGMKEYPAKFRLKASKMRSGPESSFWGVAPSTVLGVGWYIVKEEGEMLQRNSVLIIV